MLSRYAELVRSVQVVLGRRAGLDLTNKQMVCSVTVALGPSGYVRIGRANPLVTGRSRHRRTYWRSHEPTTGDTCLNLNRHIWYSKHVRNMQRSRLWRRRPFRTPSKRQSVLSIVDKFLALNIVTRNLGPTKRSRGHHPRGAAGRALRTMGVGDARGAGRIGGRLALRSRPRSASTVLRGDPWLQRRFATSHRGAAGGRPYSGYRGFAVRTTVSNHVVSPQTLTAGCYVRPTRKVGSRRGNGEP